MKGKLLKLLIYIEILPFGLKTNFLNFNLADFEEVVLLFNLIYSKSGLGSRSRSRSRSEPGVLAPWSRSRSRLKKKRGAGAGAAWKK